MLTTVVYLDFALGFGSGGLNTTAGAFRDISQARDPSNNVIITGTDFTSAALGGWSSGTSVNISPLSVGYDFNNDSYIDEEDWRMVLDAAVPLVVRALEPFDIDVQINDATSLSDIRSTLSGGGADAYALVGSVLVNGAPPSSAIWGAAPTVDDSTNVNVLDETSLTFSNNFYPDILSDSPTAEVAFRRLVNMTARIATHEAVHTFGPGEIINSLNTPQKLDGELFKAIPAVDVEGAVTDQPFLAGTFAYPLNAGQTTFSLLEATVGLKDADQNGLRDFAYFTGTGVHDVISVAMLDADTLRVVVQAYADASYATPIVGTSTRTFDIDLDEFDGEVLIDGGFGNDKILVDANVPLDVHVRGMSGNDTVELLGNGASALHSFLFEGESGNDSFIVDYRNGDPLPLLGYDFNFIGGAGEDEALVYEAGSALPQAAYFVNTFSDAPDVSVGDTYADSNSITADDEVTLRAALQEANQWSSRTYVFLPTGIYSLSVTGAAGDSEGDLDVTKAVAIIGTGAGKSVIDASALSSDRIFDIASTGSLDIRRVTLTGGNTIGSLSGAAIRVSNNSTSGIIELNVYDSSIVDNSSAANGGAISVSFDAQAVITNSVITGNVAATGGGIYASASGTSFGTVTLLGSIVANNSATTGSDLYSAQQTAQGTFISLGGNQFTSVTASNLSSSGLQLSDYVGTADYVVTSITDAYNHGDDNFSLSVREAVDNANATMNNEVWLPAWTFVLTRDRESLTPPGISSDIDASYGDIDVDQSMVIRGISFLAGGSTVQTTLMWKQGVVDEIFELLGDFDDDREVLWDDYALYTSNDPLADADEDGDSADSDDFDILDYNFGNTLTLHNILEV